MFYSVHPLTISAAAQPRPREAAADTSRLFYIPQQDTVFKAANPDPAGLPAGGLNGFPPVFFISAGGARAPENCHVLVTAGIFVDGPFFETGLCPC
jgi:hypothetical protein